MYTKAIENELVEWNLINQSLGIATTFLNHN